MLLALLLSASAQAACLVTAVDTVVKADGAGAWSEESVYAFAADEAGCTRLRLPVVGLQSLALTLDPPEGRRRPLGPERFAVEDGVATLFLPELDRGAVVEARLVRRVAGVWSWELPSLPIDRATLRRPAGSLATVSRRGAPLPAEALALRASDIRPEDALTVRISDGPPAAATPPDPRAALQPTGRSLRFVADKAAGHGEPTTGRTWIAEEALAIPLGQASRVGFRLPPTATEPWCALGDAAPAPAEDGRCTGLIRVETPIRWGYSLPSLQVVGEGPIRPDLPWRVEGADLAYFRPGIDGPEGPLTGASDRRLTFRIRAVGGQPVFPDAAAVFAALDRAARFASVPEPAVPLSLKNWRGDDKIELVEALLTQLRSEVEVVESPFGPTLQPRPLLAARRSGWASPYEAALILTRYLQQEKLDAEAIPAARGLVSPDIPYGYDAAVVRWTEGERTLWIDPACTTCALGELPLELYNAPLLHPTIARLPALPAPATGTFTGQIGADGLADGSWTFSPPLAQAVRAQLAAAEPAAGPDLLRALGAFSGGHIEAATGLGEPGAPLILRFTDGRLLPLGSALRAWDAPQAALHLERAVTSATQRWGSAPEAVRCPTFTWSITPSPTSWVERLDHAPRLNPEVPACGPPWE